MPTDFTVHGVAKLAGCSRSTVLRYEQRGVIRSKRDCNNHRRYSPEEAKKLRELLALRTESGNDEN